MRPLDDIERDYHDEDVDNGLLLDDIPDLIAAVRARVRDHRAAVGQRMQAAGDPGGLPVPHRRGAPLGVATAGRTPLGNLPDVRRAHVTETAEQDH